MKITVQGAGNAGAAYAQYRKLCGDEVTLVDKDPRKLRNADKLLMEEGHSLLGVTMSDKVPPDQDWVFCCVQTPVDNCMYLVAALREAEGQRRVILSTLFPGFPEGDYAYNPLFLRAGHGVADLQTPTKVVVAGKHSGALAKECYPNFYVHELTWERALKVKMAHNAWMCLKIEFANEVNDAEVMKVVTNDERLMSSSHMMPGAPYGGCCLPKDDVVAARHWPLIDACRRYNNNRKEVLINKWLDGPPPRGIVGLGFREGSDEPRGSLALDALRADPTAWILDSVFWEMDPDTRLLAARGDPMAAVAMGRLTNRLSVNTTLDTRKGIVR